MSDTLPDLAVHTARTDQLVSSRPTAVRVVVSLATCRRPAELARVLPELADQARALAADESAALRCVAEVHVVDNDPDGSAGGEEHLWAAPSVRYFHEPEPGISAARNRALREADDADVIIFIDDDEVPGPGWLTAMVDAWSRWRCAGIAGPVRRHFDDQHVTRWVRECGEFDRVVRPTGLRLGGGATNNLLLDLRELRRLGLRFDPAFGLSGGEDTMLTHALVRAGGEIRWCNDAEVHDYIPAHRSNRAWVLHRARRKGNSWSRVALSLTDQGPARTRQRLELTARGLHRFGHGLLRWTTGLAGRNPRRQATGARMMATAVGMVSGAYGFVVSEYLRPVAG